MKSFLELVNDEIWQDPRPWLVAGTGPSLDGWTQDLRDKYRVMAVHKAALVTDPDVVVAMDWDPLKYVLERMVPRRVIVDTGIQHIYWPRLRINEAVDRHLRKLYDTNLFVFRTHNQPDNDPEAGPGIQIRHASGEVAFDVLGHLGVREITTIGIDGGGLHAKALDEPVVTDRDPYGPHLDFIRTLCKKHGITWHRIVMFSNPSPPSSDKVVETCP